MKTKRFPEKMLCYARHLSQTKVTMKQILYRTGKSHYKWKICVTPIVKMYDRIILKKIQFEDVVQRWGSIFIKMIKNRFSRILLSTVQYIINYMLILTMFSTPAGRPTLNFYASYVTH